MTETFEPVLKLEHADSRGEIYSLALPGDKELLLIHSVAGAVRGGHAHSVDEIVQLVTGTLRYSIKRQGGQERVFEVHADKPTRLPNGGGIIICGFIFHQAGTIHMGEFLEDSWLLELKFAKKGDWTNHDDPDYRAIVKASI